MNYLCYALFTEVIVISKVKKVNGKVLEKKLVGDTIGESAHRTRIYSMLSTSDLNSTETITIVRKHKK